MALLTPPAALPTNKDSWSLWTPSMSNTSRWGGSRQVQLLPGARWKTSIQFAPQLYSQNAKAWRAFFVNLDGIAQTFKVFPEPGERPIMGNPRVNGAGQTGSTLNIKTLTNPIGTPFADVGDWISLPLPTKGYQLLMLIAVSNTDGSGNAPVIVRPQLRESPANHAVIEARRPYAEMALADDTIGWERDVMRNHTFNFDAQEEY